MHFGSYKVFRLLFGCATRAASTSCPASINCWRVFLSRTGTGRLFQTTVLEKRHPSSNLPPIVSCQTVNMEDSMMAKLRPSESGMTKQASVTMTLFIQSTVIYSRSRKCLGITSRFESVGYSALFQSWNSHGVFAFSRVARFLDFWRKSRTCSTRFFRNVDCWISSGSASTSHRHHLFLPLMSSSAPTHLRTYFAAIGSFMACSYSAWVFQHQSSTVSGLKPADGGGL